MMSIFQSFRNFIDEAKKEMEDEESRQKQKLDETISSDEFLERLEQVRKSNRKQAAANVPQEKELPQTGQRRNADKQKSSPTSREKLEREDSTVYREDYSQDYYTEAERIEPLSQEVEIDRYCAETQEKMKTGAQAEDFWTDTVRLKREFKERERKELLRQGIIMKEILDPPRSKKRYIR